MEYSLYIEIIYFLILLLPLWHYRRESLLGKIIRFFLWIVLFSKLYQATSLSFTGVNFMPAKASVFAFYILIATFIPLKKFLERKFPKLLKQREKLMPDLSKSKRK